MVVLHLAEVLVGVAAYVADGYAGVLDALADLLGQLLAALLGQGRDGEADDGCRRWTG